MPRQFAYYIQGYLDLFFNIGNDLSGSTGWVKQECIAEVSVDLKSSNSEKHSNKGEKSNNKQCVYCRKCYNSGLCMIPWPGFPVSRSTWKNNAEGNTL